MVLPKVMDKDRVDTYQDKVASVNMVKDRKTKKDKIPGDKTTGATVNDRVVSVNTGGTTDGAVTVMGGKIEMTGIKLQIGEMFTMQKTITIVNQYEL